MHVTLRNAADLALTGEQSWSRATPRRLLISDPKLPSPPVPQFVFLVYENNYFLPPAICISSQPIKYFQQFVSLCGQVSERGYNL